MLDLFSAGHVTEEGVAEEEERLGRSMRSASDTAVLGVMDVDALWRAATDTERRELVEELVQAVHVFPVHLEVEITGAPRLNVLLSEVGSRAELQTVGVGEGI